MPRPTKFTPEIGESLIRLVSAGVPKTKIAPLAGVGLRTLHEWLERGRRGEPAFQKWAARFDDETERMRRRRVNARFHVEQNEAKARWQRFKAERQRWWLERLGPEVYWTRRIAWLSARGHGQALARTFAHLKARRFRTIDTL
ncbi:hypothetical protein BH23PLA1_BH23PLA1_29530 [soil metagenome]